MRPLDFSLYVILDPVLCGGARGMVTTAMAAAAGGAGLIQLRAPGWKKRALCECARELKRALAPWSTPLIINDHADVCLACQADGLHVGQDDLPIAAARALIGPGRLLGLSTSSPETLSRADPALVDYVGAGPVFATATKPDAASPIGLAGLRALAAARPCPMVAIGGIAAANAADVMNAGVDGLAVVSAVCGQDDPESAARELYRVAQSVRSRRGADRPGS